MRPWKWSSCPPSTLLFLQEQLFHHHHRTDAQISTQTAATVFSDEGSSVWATGDSVGCVIWHSVSTHCGSWMLASCQAKQNLIPSAGKARPPLSNPMLSSLVVWSAHTALPPCISPLGWKKDPTGVHGTLNTDGTRIVKQTSNPACVYLFPNDDYTRLRYLRQRFSAPLPQSVKIKAAAFELWSSAPVPNYL